MDQVKAAPALRRVAEATKARIAIGYIAPEEVLKMFNGLLEQL